MEHPVDGQCTATTSGSFSLDINGKTVSINYDETLAAVKTKIDALSSRHTVSIYAIKDPTNTGIQICMNGVLVSTA